MTRRLTPILFLALLLSPLCMTGCRSKIPAEQVFAASMQMSADYRKEHPEAGLLGNVPPKHWPPVIRSLQPQRVYLDGVHVMIVTHETVEDEAGYAVHGPRASYLALADKTRNAPIEPLGYHVYSYNIRKVTDELPKAPSADSVSRPARP